MTEDFTPATPRQKAEFVTGLLGADDKTADAMTRLIAQRHATGWNSLQAEFDALQDAIDDAMGRPRHKHLHPLVWRTKYWWHWHITNPIVYPIMDAPGNTCRFIAWHCWRKFTDYRVMVIRPDGKGDGRIEWMGAREYRREKREMRRAKRGEQQ